MVSFAPGGPGLTASGGNDQVFAALADRTRRHLLQRLSEDGPLSATDLAGDLPMSRQAVVKHLSALGAAGLVHSDRRGREVLFAVEAEPLRAATDWLEQIGRLWDRRLVALVKHLSDQDRPVSRPRGPSGRERAGSGGPRGGRA